MRGCVLFDWGDTLMVDFPQYTGPMADWPHVEAVAGAHEVLDELRERGWQLALATNATDSDEAEIRRALARVGLDERVDRIYCARGVGHRKPSPGFFDYIMHDLQLKPSDLIMVGDDHENDVIGANRAGIRAVWLCADCDLAAVDNMQRVAHQLALLPEVLESWF